MLFGSPPLYTSTSSSFYDHFNIKPGTAAVLALKDHDPNAPAAVYNLPKALSTQNKQELADWVRTSIVSIAPMSNTKDLCICSLRATAFRVRLNSTQTTSRTS